MSGRILFHVILAMVVAAAGCTPKPPTDLDTVCEGKGVSGTVPYTPTSGTNRLMVYALEKPAPEAPASRDAEAPRYYQDYVRDSLFSKESVLADAHKAALVVCAIVTPTDLALECPYEDPAMRDLASTMHPGQSISMASKWLRMHNAEVEISLRIAQTAEELLHETLNLPYGLAICPEKASFMLGEKTYVRTPDLTQSRELLDLLLPYVRPEASITPTAP